MDCLYKQSSFITYLVVCPVVPSQAAWEELLQQLSWTKKPCTNNLLSLVVVANKAEKPLTPQPKGLGPTSEHQSSPPDNAAALEENAYATRQSSMHPNLVHLWMTLIWHWSKPQIVQWCQLTCVSVQWNGKQDQMERSLADEKLISIYRDSIHHNFRLHLSSNIVNDEEQQFVYCKVVSFNHQKYKLPSGKLGKLIVSTLAHEFKGICKNWCDSKSPLLFLDFIICKTHTITAANYICAHIMQQLDWLDVGDYIALINNSCDEANIHTVNHKDPTFEAKSQCFNNLVLDGHLSTAIKV